jgi:hypothetical protein
LEVDPALGLAGFWECAIQVLKNYHGGSLLESLIKQSVKTGVIGTGIEKSQGMPGSPAQPPCVSHSGLLGLKALQRVPFLVMPDRPPAPLFSI